MFKKIVQTVLVLFFLLFPLQGVLAQENMDESYNEAVEEMEATIEEMQEDVETEVEESSEEMMDTYNEMVGDMEESYDEAREEMLGGMVIGSTVFLLVTGFIALLAIGGLILNIVMIIDCVNREFKDKTLWLVLLIAGTLMGWGLIPGVLYYFLVKKKLGPVEKRDEVESVPPTQGPQPVQQ